MNSRSKFLASFAGCALAIWWFWPSPSTPPTAATVLAATTGDTGAVVASVSAPTAVAPSTTSPFSRGTARPPSHDETIKTVRAALKGAGMRTPDRYYAMGYKELRSLADQGNIYAQIQLGAQYAFANSALEYDPDYDFSKSPREEAFKLFSKIALRGNVAALEMLSTKLADVNPVEAYSWKLLSDGTGGENQRDFFKQNQYAFQLTPADLAKAKARSQQLLQLMMAQPLQPLPAD